MQGQDAVQYLARAFGDALPLTGVVLTKLDGDARGGAALSVRHVTGKPLKFVGVSKLDGLEPFHPKRMAQRVLGMGDIVSLVEQAQKNIDIAEAQKLASKIKSGNKFDLNDFRDQLSQVRSWATVARCWKAARAVPAGGRNCRAGREATAPHRGHPELPDAGRAPPSPKLIKASRKLRIAAGAGVPVQVNRLLSQFEQMQGMMKQMKKAAWPR